MNNGREKKLLLKVKKDYNIIAESFSNTRNHDWKEFELIKKYLIQDADILDVGCGNGRLVSFLNKNITMHYLGVDNSHGLIQESKKLHPEQSFEERDILNLKDCYNKYDITFCIAVLHHLPSAELRKKAIIELAKTLKPNGIAMITAWNLFQPKYEKHLKIARLKNIISLGIKKAQDTFIPWGKTGIKRYYYAFKQEEIESLIQKCGLLILEKTTGNNFVFICKKR